MDDIANAAGFSKFYFSKLFKEHTKITVFDYLRNVRCEEARRLIETTKLSITEISEKCGFEDIAYFTKVFKKKPGFSHRR
ncbi:MAG: helix-turn-helix transcriptional regulator [Clostridia bacterium]|nr:helix-turn-helix transcriptional regulator [Clostridia bacterium]